MKDAREHHFKFKHQLITLMLEDPRQIINVLGGPQGTQALQVIWQKVGELIETGDRFEPTGLSSGIWPHEKKPQFVTITFPEAFGRGEPIFMALLPVNDIEKEIAVLLLEKSFNPKTDEPITMLVGVSGESRHNFGPFHANPSLDSFCQKIIELGTQS